MVPMQVATNVDAAPAGATRRAGGGTNRLTPGPGSGTVRLVQALPQSCPPLPDLPPLFWNEVTKQVGYWQEFFAQAQPGEADPEEMRKICIARIKTRLKRVYAGKNGGRNLFEMAQYVACLRVIESRN